MKTLPHLVINVHNNPVLATIVQKLLFEYGASWAFGKTQEPKYLNSGNYSVYTSTLYYGNDIKTQREIESSDNYLIKGAQLIDAATEFGKLIDIVTQAENNVTLPAQLGLYKVSQEPHGIKVGCTIFTLADVEKAIEISKQPKSDTDKIIITDLTQVTARAVLVALGDTSDKYYKEYTGDRTEMRLGGGRYQSSGVTGFYKTETDGWSKNHRFYSAATQLSEILEVIERQKTVSHQRIQNLTVRSEGNGSVIIDDDVVVTKKQLELFKRALT